MSGRAETAVAEMLRYLLATYQTPNERAAIRGAIREAVAVCDAIASDILQEHRCRGGKGKTTHHGHELAAIAKRCADVLHEARVHVQVGKAVPAETVP